MTQADSVHSTPPTNTHIMQRQTAAAPTRRRFLTIAAGASAISVASLAAAATVPSLPQAVVLPRLAPADTSPVLRSAVRALAKAHDALIAAQATNEEAEAIWQDWEDRNPQPASRRGRKRWIRRADVQRQALVSKPWQALMKAELVFAGAQIGLAVVPIASTADLEAMAACSVTYDRVDLARVNRAPIGLMVAREVSRLGMAVQS
jgi:hypothetical protein